jgi:hypothetical protein
LPPWWRLYSSAPPKPTRSSRSRTSAAPGGSSSPETTGSTARGRSRSTTSRLRTRRSSPLHARAELRAVRPPRGFVRVRHWRRHGQAQAAEGPARPEAQAGRAVASLIHTQGIGDLYRIYATAQRDGVDFNLGFIPPSFNAPHPEELDNAYMAIGSFSNARPATRARIARALPLIPTSTAAISSTTGYPPARRDGGVPSPCDGAERVAMRRYLHDEVTGRERPSPPASPRACAAC